MTSTTTSWAVVLIAVLLLGVTAVWPLFVSFSPDRGDGLGRVTLPRPTKTPPRRPRTVLFLLGGVASTVVFAAWSRPGDTVTDLTARLAQTLSSSPSQVSAYASYGLPALQVIGASYFVLFALVTRSGLLRRTCIALHALLFLGLVVLVDACLVAAAVYLRAGTGLLAVSVVVASVACGGLTATRMTMTSFQLPRPTAVPRRRPAYRWDSLLTVLSLVVGLAALTSWFVFGGRATSASGIWITVVPVTALTIGLVAQGVFLFGVSALRARPMHTVYDGPLQIITPAWNEQAGIGLTLDSIDRAAAFYPGDVHVILSDDGSTDATVEIATAAMAGFRYATGEILRHPNTGKAGALNRALARASSSFVVRIDADVVIDDHAFRYVIDPFADPQVAVVGALMLPRQDGTSWFHRMRALECAFQFGFARRGQMTVDGLTVVPGTFTAFRRAPAVEVGGFVDGMNGEDSDLVMQLGRLGWRSVLDPRIRAYEDVPPVLGEFLEQRTRWTRGGVHVFARHNPFSSGLAGPRTWYWLVRRGLSWLTMVAALFGPFYVLSAAVFHPSSQHTLLRVVVLVALAGAVFLGAGGLAAVWFRQWRSLPWLPTWVVFVFVRRIASLESFITLPTRPVVLREARRVGSRVVAAR